MRKNKQEKQSAHAPGGFDHTVSNSDFYTGAPTEQPLYQDRPGLDRKHVRKTARHKAVTGRRKEAVDPREKMALLAILKTAVLILLLLIAFFMLWKGIKIYEESVWMESQPEAEISPVMSELPVPEQSDSLELTGESFASRIEAWSEAERLVGLADALLLRNNYDAAIERCQAALRLVPAHMEALEKLGVLYYEKGMYPESINTYIRLISVDPSRKDLNMFLIKALDAHGDSSSVIAVAQWFREAHGFDDDVQRFLAHAYFEREEYAEAATAYELVLKDTPQDVTALQSLATSYIRLEQYDKALMVLDQLRIINYRDANCYKQIAICQAQLGNGLETVQTLGKAAHLFGQSLVVGWIQDPQLDPVREDRTFQAFTDRVGGEEFRLYLEKMAKAMEGDADEGIDPQLTLPEREEFNEELLRPQQ